MKRQEVDERYKEDSTKGGSLINPVSYKGDVMVQVWMDSRVLATLCKWMENEGEYPRFLSHVVRMPLEMLADHMVDDGKVEMVDDTKEARTLLESRFHVSLNKGKRGRKNLLHNVVLSSRRGTDLGNSKGSIDYTRYSEEEPVERRGREEVVAEYRKGEARKKQEMKDAMEKEKQKAIDGGLVVDVNNTPVTNREMGLTKLVEADRRLEEIKSESPMLSQEEIVAKYQAEQKGEIFVRDKGVTVKEGMTDEEYEIKMKEIATQDKARLELERSAEVSEDDIVRS